MTRFTLGLLVLVGLFSNAVPTAIAQNTISISRATVLLDRQLEVPAREIGVLAMIKVKPGMAVKDGDLLGSLDITEAELALLRAQVEHSIATQKANSEIDILASKKSRDVAQADLDRAEVAVAKVKKAVSQTERDRLKLNVERADLAIRQAYETQSTSKLQMKLTQNDVDQAKRVLDRHLIRSSLTGIVDQVNRQKGEWVKPGDSVFRILQLDKLRCEGFVNASLLEGNMTGRSVQITVYLDEEQKKKKTLTGRLVFVGSEINSIKGDVRVRAEFANPKLIIRPGMNAEMEILPKTSLAKTEQSANSKASGK